MSFINHIYKHIFIHVPKVAGTAMESRNFVGGTGHDSLHNMSLREDFDPSYFKWAFVRNPYTRLASAYFYTRNIGSGIVGYNPFYDPGGTFMSFVDHLEENLTEDPFNEKIRPNWKQPHITPMAYLLKSDKYELDFIGRYENLQNDFRKVVKIISDISGIEIKCYRGAEVIPYILPVHGETKNRPSDYMLLYNQERRDKVYNIYREDFERYEYRK